MSRLRAVTLLLASAWLGGCSYFSAQEKLNQADLAFDEIDRGDAKTQSPYHYYAAQQYLERAQRENRSSDFVSAELFATRSLDHSSRALEHSGGAGGAIEDPWASDAPADPWGADAAPAGEWGTDEGGSGWAEPAEQTAPVVEFVPVPVEDPERVPADEVGGGASFTVTPEPDGDAGWGSSEPDLVVVPDAEPDEADLVIEPVP